MDEYLTIKGRSKHQTRVRGSRFIASVAPASSEEEAQEFVTQVSGKHQDATHNCYAYRVGLGDRAVHRYSDAGEPTGTAGRPLLEAIQDRKLTNTVVVVSRYFGGTKLGKGGLARAYKETAVAALDEVGMMTAFVTDEFPVSFPYRLTREVERLLKRRHVRTVEEKYGQLVTLTLRVRQSQSDGLRKELAMIGDGEVGIGDSRGSPHVVPTKRG